MVSIRIVSSVYSIPDIQKPWVAAQKFNSKDRLVDHEGKPIDVNHKGHYYRIIDKQEREYSRLEIVGRCFLGTLKVISTIFIGLCFKSFRDLFTKSKETVRYAVQETQTDLRIENGITVYHSPETLFSGTPLNRDKLLNLARIKSIGKETLVPVVSDNYSMKYQEYEGPIFEALFKMASSKENESRSAFKEFFEHPSNDHSQKDELLKFLLEKPSDSTTTRIFHLERKSLLDILQMIKAKGSTLSCKEHNNYGKDLFAKWAGQGRIEITNLLLELDPTYVDQSYQEVKRAFLNAVSNTSKEEAKLLLSIIRDKQITLSEEEMWLAKTLDEECTFDNSSFMQLNDEQKQKIFYSANAFGNYEMVKRLRGLGMGGELPIYAFGYDLFAYNMDVTTANETMERFLKDLRKNGSLMTAEEFKRLDQRRYLKKSNMLERIQGRNFLEKLIQKHGCKHVKVPKKIAVLNQGVETIQMHTNYQESDRYFASYTIANHCQFEIFAEKIQPFKRTLILEEAIELMTIILESGYVDFGGNNLFIAKDGVYFIDTEFKSFLREYDEDGPPFKVMENLKNLLNPKDVETYLAAFNKAKETYEKGHEAREERKEQVHKIKRRSLFDSYKKHTFTFPVSSII